MKLQHMSLNFRKRSVFLYKILLCLLTCFSFSIITGQESETKVSFDSAIFSQHAIRHPVRAMHGMVSTQEKLASEAGLRVLQEGGNAVDAAVTIGFTLAVTLPRAGNIGGGGFMIVHHAKTGETIAIDYRETAPEGASKDMFLNKQGDVDPSLSTGYPLGVGVPGTVHGLLLALDKFGSISRQRAMQSAITLADTGITITPGFHRSLKHVKSAFSHSQAAMKTFYLPNGEPPPIGSLLRQPELAQSLKLISEKGFEGFYQGPVAEAISNDMKKNGGLITMQDLANYQPVIRKPVTGNYRGYTITSMPPPSSGGVHLIQMLNMLEPFDLASSGHNSADAIHRLAEIMKLAYADRSKYLGDPAFNIIPAAQITSQAYAECLLSEIDLKAARASKEIHPGNPYAVPDESNETTHFSVVDQWGNAVANTYTLNFSYGCKYMIPGTGILMNNEMDDFSAKTGVPNAYGLIGGKFNSVEPQKRMLSSMSPTIVLKNGKVFLVTGSPGGSRIITSVMQIISNVIDHEMNIADATHATRIHHQWLPDELRVEAGISKDTINILESMGHHIKVKTAMGATQSILITNEDHLEGASDPRREGSLTIGY